MSASVEDSPAPADPERGDVAVGGAERERGDDDAVGAEPPRLARWGPVAVVIVAVVLGAALRIWFLLTPTGALDGDEAVTGIMAHRIAEGDDLYLFFAGQGYNSAIEQYPQALLFALGVPEGAFTLRLPQLAMALTSIVLLYRVGLRVLATRWHAALAAALFAFGPYPVIWRGVRSSGSYVAEIVVMLVAALCALSLDEVAGRPRLVRAATFGVLFGATYQLNPSAYALLVPLGAWMVPTLWRDRRALAATVAGLVVSVLPLVYWRLAAGAVPQPTPGTRPSTPLSRWGDLTDEIGRQFLGLAHLAGRPGWPVGLGRVVVALVLVAAAAALVQHRRSILAVVTLRTEGRRPFTLVLLAVPLTVALYVGSRYAWFTTEPRYLFCAYPVLVLGLAAVPPARRWWGPLTGVVLLGLVAGPSIWLVASHADERPEGRDEDLEEAVDLLVAEDERFVYADYWTAMNLQFEAGDRLTVGSLNVPRFADDRAAVDAAPDPVWVASAGVNTDDRGRMRDALEAAGVAHRERTIGLVTIFDRIDPDVRPWEIGLGEPPP
jgi:hypothetical protein